MEHENILRMIDEATSPDKMSKEDALEWLEQLSTELEGRMDGLKDEIEE